MFRLGDGGLKEAFCFGILLLLIGPPSGGHLLEPASLVFFDQLQQNVIAVDCEDRSYITGMQPGETFPIILPEIGGLECSQISTRSGGWVVGVLHVVLLKC